MDDSQNVGPEKESLVAGFTANFRSIKAGNALSISTPTGSWPDLVLDNEYATYDFQTDVFSLGDLPHGTTPSIPGDEFPAFESIAIPSVERFSEASLSDITEDQITPDMQVSWTPPISSNPQGIATIALYEYIVDQDSNTEASVDIFCTINDDGEFSFPDKVKQFLLKYRFTTEDIYLSRYSVTSKVQGNAVVIIVNGAHYIF